MGRQPVIVSRDARRRAHRGRECVRPPRGDGLPAQEGQPVDVDLPVPRLDVQQLRQVAEGQGRKGAGYPEQFNKDGSHDMPKVPRFESYRGFLFGSLNPDVLPLQEHLGETTKMIDMMVDASPEGLEVLKGASTYTYDGNWKVQAENGADGYHVAATHWNYAATTARRSTGESVTETKAMDAGS